MKELKKKKKTPKYNFWFLSKTMIWSSSVFNKVMQHYITDFKMEKKKQKVCILKSNNKEDTFLKQILGLKFVSYAVVQSNGVS